jgi:3',5'-cyclic AMP phosphodiesterase CpdA
MRTVVHLSDLHFGRTDPALLDPLTAIVHALRPDLIVVSGDLTQRARTAQFIEARAFLDRLPTPQLIVPGNHDVPLYDVLARFLRPLARYRRYITDDLEPCFIDEEIAVLGVNTARSLTFKQGRINEEQIARVRERLCALPDLITKVVVTHHPFDLPSGYDSDDLVRRAALAREMLSACRCDLLLAGHLHLSVATEGSIRSNANVYEPIVVQAGSATSTRSRGESNSFNVIRIESRHIEVRRYMWQPSTGAFDAAANHRFQCTAGGWKRVPA